MSALANGRGPAPIGWRLLRPPRPPGALPARTRAVLVLALALALGGAQAPAHAGSLSVRDAQGTRWQVSEDQAEGAQGYVLQRATPDGRPDLHFGRGGSVPVMISSTNDAPTSIRVDARRRIWLAGASIAGGQPQAVVERFLPDGAIDLDWGVQGKVQAIPAGIAIKPNDLLPLSDGSVLVAGVAANVEPARALVFRFKPDGRVDTAFGTGGIWQPAAAAAGSTATCLAASPEGAVAVSVAAPGSAGVVQIWALGGGPARRLAERALAEASDGEDACVAWSGQGWDFTTSGASTGALEPASVEPPALMPSVASTEPGQDGFSPFAAESSPATPRPPVQDWPWIGMACAAIVAAVFAGVIFVRGRGARRGLKAGPGG
jgi:uncharacterized delta-60 repeat protein